MQHILSCNYDRMAPYIHDRMLFIVACLHASMPALIHASMLSRISALRLVPCPTGRSAASFCLKG